MEDAFKIYVDQLRNGSVETIHEVLSPAFLDVKEKNLKFEGDVIVDGEAYLADHDLILKLTIRAEATMPCSICSEPVRVPVEVIDMYHSEPYETIKSGIFIFKDVLREAIILETPQFAECNGDCPKRKDLAKYLKKEPVDGQDDEGYRPFSDLKLK